MWKVLVLFVLASNQCVVGAYRHDKFVRMMQQKQAAMFKGNEVPLSEYSTQMNNIPVFGLPKCSACLNIAVIGAGVSGLTASVELARAGHRVTIYEGSSRVGGRILTYRQPGTNYVTELGAMRLPLDAHRLLSDYVKKRYNLPFKEFINSDDDAMVFINNVRLTVREADRNPDALGFNVTEDERGKTAAQLWDRAIERLLKMKNETGHDNFIKIYGSYSIDQYLTSVNMSRAAIDYVGLMLNIETNLHTSLTESISDMEIISDDTKFYYIEGGNDRLTEALIKDCLSIPEGRCNISYDSKIVTVDLNDRRPNDIGMEYVTSNSMLPKPTDRYHTVIVSTTATAARLIEFKNPDFFKDKYRALRQVHYDCASKVSLFFKKAWWLDLGIDGGRSTTDLLARFAYFQNFNGSYVGGAAIIGSYTWSQDAIVWQSLSDNVSINTVLSNLNSIYSTPNVPSFSDGGKVKHWCDDPWSHGAFVLFTPYQELHLKRSLRDPVGSIYFIGEHTSSAHAWIEGGILSALEAALKIQEEYFDVAIVGGGPIGLATAINLAKRNGTLKIVVIEQNELGNSEGSSGSSDTRQFRQMYSERYLAELAIKATEFWKQLEVDANLKNGTLLNTDDGYLFFGDPGTGGTTEGDINNIEIMCRALSMGCEFLNSSDLDHRYPFFSRKPTYKGIFHPKSGYINVTALLHALKDLAVQKNITIRTNEAFLELDPTVSEKENHVRLFTNRGSLNASKVVFATGPFSREVSESLGFILNMTIWELPTLYFPLKSTNETIPTWFVFGGDKQSLYYGFSLKSSDRPGYVKISPDFIQDFSKPLLYPKDRKNTTDPWLIQKTIDWVANNIPSVDHFSYQIGNFTCLATFLSDDGFIISYLPKEIRYHDKLIMYAGGWGMKFVPLWADIISDLVSNPESTKYAPYLPELSFNVSHRWSPINNSTPPISESVSIATNKQLILSFLLIYVLIVMFSL
ncbi:unnamed protein product [Rotaria magnacalcarata]|uniref:Amine oxidase n=1 Tax=Rotaria magnacalcarata TaxID=392030 RepID=A0A816X089_9BILA|nr:unnamed protein product [Rotaria magnacalcarata]CAF4104712.1 unnamed protein product [Rotaria magnacalcarata]